MSNLEQQFAFQVKSYGLPEPATEYRFAAHYVGLGRGVRERLLKNQLRDWRFDFAWPDIKLAVEIEGINPDGSSRHQRIKGFNGDLRKYHAAQSLGWTVYRTGRQMIKSGESILLIQKLIFNLTEKENED